MTGQNSPLAIILLPAGTRAFEPNSFEMKPIAQPGWSVFIN
jgi:hypothetical protein